MSCPPTLYFDPRFNICNYPDQVDCKMPSTTEAAPSTTEEVVDTTTEAAPSTTEEVVDTTTEEVVDTTTTEDAPSTTEEAVDTTTANVEETTTVMLKGKMSNETTTMATPTSPPPTQTTQTATNATDVPTEMSSTPTTVPSTTSGVSVVCPPSEDGFPVFVPHPTDCTKYYECQKDWPILMECAPPLYFDPSISACNWPSQVDCQ